jgi:hypothetical protein
MNKYYERVSSPEMEAKLQELENLEQKLTAIYSDPSGENPKKSEIFSWLGRIPSIAQHIRDGLSGKDLDELKIFAETIDKK